MKNEKLEERRRKVPVPVFKVRNVGPYSYQNDRPNCQMFEQLPVTSQEFYSSLLVQALCALKVNTYWDNFDAQRFNFDGKDRSGEFEAATHAFYFNWFWERHEELFRAYSHLADEQSKRLYLFLIAYRLCGHFCVKIPVGFDVNSPAYREYLAIQAEGAKASELSVNGAFGALKHFDFAFRGERYIVDALGLDYYLMRNQYFLSRNGLRIAPEEGDMVIDGGACLGDTAAVFSVAVGEKGRVYSFDPVAPHLQVLEYNAKQFPLRNVSVMPYGLSDHEVVANPVMLPSYNPGFNSTQIQGLPLRSIDQLVEAGAIANPDFIKLDIEGAELDALKGAGKSIRRHRPKLAVSLYHKPNDLFEIVLYIKENFPFYECYLDHYTIHMEETVLYCTTRS